MTAKTMAQARERIAQAEAMATAYVRAGKLQAKQRGRTQKTRGERILGPVQRESWTAPPAKYEGRTRARY